LRGPNLTYYRAAQGVRDTAEMYATSRPTIDYREHPDSGEPYRIIADRVRLKGNDRVWGGGDVVIDRSDLTANSDSMALDEIAGLGVLVGRQRPKVQGKGTRSYQLVGRRIEFELEQRDMRRVRALGEGQATSAEWRLTADTVVLSLERRKLQQVFAWGDSSRPDAVSSRNTLKADSLALDVPDEVLTEARAFRKASSTSQRDSTAKAERDWMVGDTITANWAQVAEQAKLVRLAARGNARAFTHLRDDRDSTATPSLNYSRGKVIDIRMQGDRIDRVLVTGRADGVQLEPLAVDTTAAGNRPDSAR
jgi:hypothetical protein